MKRNNGTRVVTLELALVVEVASVLLLAVAVDDGDADDFISYVNVRVVCVNNVRNRSGFSVTMELS